MELKELMVGVEGVEKSKALEIRETFEPMVEMLLSFEEKFKEITSQDPSSLTCKQAGVLRKEIATVRIKADKVRMGMKRQYLDAGNAIQGVYNILKQAVSSKENALKDYETYFEQKAEIEKTILLNNRLYELKPFLISSDQEFDTLKLKHLDEKGYQEYKTIQKNLFTSHNELKAEQERIEEEEKNKARIENERLKAVLEEERVLNEKKMEALVNAQVEKEKEEKALALKKKKESLKTSLKSEDIIIADGILVSVINGINGCQNEKLKILLTRMGTSLKMILGELE